MTEGPMASRHRLTDAAMEDMTGLGSESRVRAARRDAGLRSTRRATTWTAAALIAGVAVTTGYFAHSTTAAVSPSGGVRAASPGAATAGPRPSVRHPVAISGGSGVTVGSSGGGVTGGSANTGAVPGSGQTSWQDN
jgi:hypothetical protein